MDFDPEIMAGTEAMYDALNPRKLLPPLRNLPYAVKLDYYRAGEAFLRGWMGMGDLHRGKHLLARNPHRARM
jgi:hypothetical protein